MKILGIDPGIERVGIAIIEKTHKGDTLLHSECFKTPRTEHVDDRIFLIGKKITEIINVHKPEILAIETLFFNTNKKTAMMVSEARGVIVYEAKKLGLQINEYSPLQIKIAVTGYGKADKKQVETMTRKLIKIDEKKRHDDEIDAIAIALTGLYSTKQYK